MLDKNILHFQKGEGTMKRPPKFKAKVRESARVYHYWRQTEVKGLFATICNPGLQRASSELFETQGGEALCKVCKIHM